MRFPIQHFRGTIPPHSKALQDHSFKEKWNIWVWSFETLLELLKTHDVLFAEQDGELLLFVDDKGKKFQR